MSFRHLLRIPRSRRSTHRRLRALTITLTLAATTTIALTHAPTTTRAAALDPSFGTSHNIWIDRDTLQTLPTNGQAWDQIATQATNSWGTANIADQESNHDVYTLAGALYAVRTNNTTIRNKVAQAIETAIGTEDGGRTLALGRNLTGYVLAADLIGHRTNRFTTWLDDVRHENLDGRTLITTHNDRPNNWGTHAGAARIAAARYLGDTTDLTAATTVFRGYLGDRNAYNKFKYGDPEWQSDPTAPVPINPTGATINGINVDGAIVDDVRRCLCDVQSPAPRENYQWEAMQGIVTQAALLDMAGHHDIWTWSDNAIHRATDFLYTQANYPAEGDDTFLTYLLDYGLATTYSHDQTTRPGKSIGYTDWTHAGRPGPTGGVPDTARSVLGTGKSIGGITDIPAYTSLEPARFVDTRPNGDTVDNRNRRTGVNPAGTSMTVDIAGRSGIPDDINAVVVNLTALGADASGHATVYPCTTDVPTASTLNYSPGEVAPNEVVAEVDANGRICIYTHANVHIIADIVGYAANGSPHTPITPARYADTRNQPTFDNRYRDTGPLEAGQNWKIKIAGRGDIPGSATTAVLNVTAVNPQAAGHITVYPCTPTAPDASSINYFPGQVRANEVVAELDPDGHICIRTHAATHIIIDAVGYLTPTTSYTPTDPTRYADTRNRPTFDGQASNTGPIPAGTVRKVKIAGRGIIPASATTATLNITAVNPRAAGHLTVYPCTATVPTASHVNYTPGDVRANEVIADLDATGHICVYTHATTHLIVDATGHNN